MIKGLRPPHGLLLLLLLLCNPAGADAGPVILVFGDSLSAAHGLRTEQGWVALLQQRLRQQGYPHRLVNASLSGDTTDSGLQRLPRALRRHRPELVILELGGNDGLHGLPPERTHTNLARMIRLIQASGAQVLLVGMQIPPNYGPRFAQRFRQIYPSLAREFGIPLVPFLLAGLENRRDLFQADQIHPNARAQPLLLENVWAALAPLLRGRATATPGPRHDDAPSESSPAA